MSSMRAMGVSDVVPVAACVSLVPTAIDEDDRPFAELLFAASAHAAKDERQCMIVARRYGLEGDGGQRLAVVAASLDRRRCSHPDEASGRPSTASWPGWWSLR